MLAEDGVLTGDDDQVTVDSSERAVERWGTELLTTAEDLLRWGANELRQLAVPVQGAILGLHPHADGTPCAPESVTLADGQLRVLLHTAGLLSDCNDQMAPGLQKRLLGPPPA
ncbi:hypothetical protein [Streptosporangium sp. KLBMP 9127]|nr:hypothetical protein [Streptosporangium sp. KLBMP 9127]